VSGTMPRLSYPRLTKGNAINALLRLYRDDPGFMKELNALRSPYMQLLDRFSIDSLNFLISAPPLSSKEWLQALLDYDPGKGKTGPFPAEEEFPYSAELQPYFDGLSRLAYKWKLRARWAVLMLFYLDISDCWKARNLPTLDEFKVPPLEELDSAMPWELPTPPLTLVIPAWAVVLLGREAILEEVSRRLRQYEDEVKASGLKEYPSALEHHARWWFEHYVHREKYDDIAQEEMHTPGGSLISYAKNVGNAVRKFSRSIGIEVRDLKYQD
jgi:hypothetical protein